MYIIQETRVLVEGAVGKTDFQHVEKVETAVCIVDGAVVLHIDVVDVLLVAMTAGFRPSLPWFHSFPPSPRLLHLLWDFCRQKRAWCRM